VRYLRTCESQIAPRTVERSENFWGEFANLSIGFKGRKVQSLIPLGIVGLSKIDAAGLQLRATIKPDRICLQCYVAMI
jgi:hypothetical protein